MHREFNNLVNLFKNLSSDDKKEALINEFKISLATIEKLNNDINSNHELLINREILDVNNKNATYDDYLHTMCTYI